MTTENNINNSNEYEKIFSNQSFDPNAQLAGWCCLEGRRVRGRFEFKS